MKCTRCKKPIVFARTMAAPSGTGGKAMPLDLYPDPDGNVAVRDTGRGHLVCRVLGKDEDHDRQVEQRAMPHFATCGVEQGKQLADDVEPSCVTTPKERHHDRPQRHGPGLPDRLRATSPEPEQGHVRAVLARGAR
jgi:hypothetical protein